MPKLPWRIWTLVQTLSDNLLMAEGLLFPDTNCLHTDLPRLRKAIGKRLRREIKQLPPQRAYRHRLGAAPHVATLEVVVPPLRQDDLRRSPVTLRLQYVQWRHRNEAAIAYIPTLQIEVMAADESQLQQLLLPQVQSALARRKTAAQLRTLVLLDRPRQLEVRPIQMQVAMPTRKEAAIRERRREQQQKSVLKQVAVELAQEALPTIVERQAELARLQELLTGTMPRSVLLVGRSGVGKTAIVRELARQQREQSDAARLSLWSTSGARIVAGTSGFGMWQERCEQILREAARRKAILHLGSLAELAEVGKGGGNMQSVASVLRPAIASGKVLTIAECAPEELAHLERAAPQLLEAFVRLDVAATRPEQTWRILEREAADQKHAAPLSSAALAMLDRLHRRYATYSAAPGRPLRFLRNLLHDRSGDQPIESREVAQAFSRETGLPLFMLDDQVGLDLTATREWFTQRVIGQPEPVNLVVDLLATTKTGLSRGGKPIASLLFIGPTGVGKTEMAKSLAEFLYQDRGRMIRFDMSEYAHPAAVERLIGSAGRSQGLLTQKVRDQPFMVVLLDEFEKAHPSFYDVLLQVLGEGRLTDGAGRVADFTSTVVIMTSNLGVETFRQASIGFGEPSAAVALHHFEREVKAFLRPEMYNRIDRIVPFAPLSPAVIASIAQREVDRALQRDGVRLRGVQVAVDSAAVQHLARRGFEPRYGARPLKRAMERELITPLAERLASYAPGQTIECVVHLEDGQIALETSARPLSTAQRVAGQRADTSVPAAINELQELRRQVQSLENSGVLLRIRNDLERLAQLERQRRRRAKRRGENERYAFSRENRRALEQQRMLARVDKLSHEVSALEEMTLMDFYAARPIEASFVTTARDELYRQLQLLLFDLYRDSGARNSELTVAIYGQSLRFVCLLAKAYERLCQQEGNGIRQRYWLKLYREELDIYRRGDDAAERPPAPPPNVTLPSLHLKSRKLSETDEQRKVVGVYTMPVDRLYEPPSDAIGLVLQVTSPQGIALLETESGKHNFLKDRVRQATCFVETLAGPLINYDPPADVGRVSAFPALRVRRDYDFTAELCRDAIVEKDFAMRGDVIDQGLEEAVRDYLMQRVWDLIETWN